MTIEFEKPAEICKHAAPTFGCRGCIDRDREAVIREFFLTAPRPNCPNHGPMMIATGDRAAVTVTYECAADEDCGASEEVSVR